MRKIREYQISDEEKLMLELYNYTRSHAHIYNSTSYAEKVHYEDYILLMYAENVKQYMKLKGKYEINSIDDFCYAIVKEGGR